MNYIDQLSQSVDSNQIRQEFMSKPKQWPSKIFVAVIKKNIFLYLQAKQIETNIRQPLTIQSGRNQPRLQNSMFLVQIRDFPPILFVIVRLSDFQ